MREHSSTGLVVLCSHGINDPLVSSLMLDYAFRLQADGSTGRMILFTEEPGRTVADPELVQRLVAHRIYWVPLRYRLDRPQMAQKAWNMLRILWSASRFALGEKRCSVIGFLAQAGAYGAVLRSFWFRHFVLLCFEPHSLYMLEQGIWARDSLKYRLSRFLERFQARRADVIIVPTRAAQDLVVRLGARGRVAYQPITLAPEGNLRDTSLRDVLRAEWGWTGKEVLVYVGKFGGIYHTAPQFVQFMQRLADQDDRYRYLIIASRTACNELSGTPGFEAMAARTHLHGPVHPAELARLLSVADAGVIAIPPTPAQAYRTPVKTAHYWMAGLPIVVPKGVSDDHVIASEEGVGVVVSDLPAIDVDAYRRDMDLLLADGPQALQERCMAAGLKHRNTRHMVELLRECLP